MQNKRLPTIPQTKVFSSKKEISKTNPAHRKARRFKGLPKKSGAQKFGGMTAGYTNLVSMAGET